MQRTDFHFELPEELIAQRPVTPRSASRLLVLDGESGVLADRTFRELPQLLRAGDVLVFNDTRVVPARVHATKDTGGKIELLLERAESADTALVQARASKGLRPGATVSLPGGHSALMLEREGDLFRLKFSSAVLEFFEAHGEVPLPPYIVRPPDGADRERYQTVYARIPGAVAAPTAGLHFDGDLLAGVEARGVGRAFVTLHVGAGTFQPVRVDHIDEHEMHREYLEVGARSPPRGPRGGGWSRSARPSCAVSRRQPRPPAGRGACASSRRTGERRASSYARGIGSAPSMPW
jgi:S-adenosylmethionine:tRNA ribosyltransferase-isomerase